MRTRKQANSEFLDLFFPIHYLVGIQIEDALRSGLLSRQQACILWTIRAKGDGGTQMRRKDVEKALSSWYEVTSSAVSKSLRALTRAPLDFLTMTEDPENGREKFVTLTPRGKQFVESMIRNGTALMDLMVERMTQDEIDSGIHFLSRVTDIYHEVQDEEAEQLRAIAINPKAKP